MIAAFFAQAKINNLLIPWQLELSPADSIQFSVYFKESSALQLISGISNDLPKLLKYFNGTAFFTLLFLPSASVLPIILDFYLNEELFAVHTFASVFISSLLKFHKLPEVSE